MGDLVDVDQRTGARPSATLRDVARESGVSVTTVSRILNKRGSGVPIREETKRRVEETAARLGYRPNLLARSLRGQRSTLIGVIARDISDPFHIQILKGVNARALERGYRLFLGDVDYRSEETLAYGSMFERSHADGIIVIGDIEGGEAADAELASHHRSFVGVTDRTTRKPFPGVYADSEAGTVLALEHLWELGHRSILCVSDARTADGRLRIETYERFMREHGAETAIDVQVTDQLTDLAFELGQRLFGRHSEGDYTAIYAASDSTAVGLLQAAHQSGLQVPRDLSIVGFDDIDIARYTIPPLTTIRQGGLEMGRAAVDLLMRMIEDEIDRDRLEDVVLDPTLVVRESTAPPRKKE
jgi:DNA-binding LacI/PurR family transcriptional regulator